MRARTRFAGTVFALATALGQCSALDTVAENLDPGGEDTVVEEGVVEDGGTETDPSELDDTAGADVETDVFLLAVGDCVNSGDLDGLVETVPVVPCDEPHDSEAFASMDMPAGDYPGDTAVDDAAQEFCYAELEAFVGLEYLYSTLDTWPLTPTAESWEGVDDRQLLCFVYDPAGQVTGTLAGAAR